MRPAQPQVTEAEAEIRAACAAGDHARAFERALSSYREELSSFLHGLLRDDDQAREVMAELVEGLWKGLPGFRWESSLRTWAYRLARNATFQHRKARARRERLAGDRELPEASWRDRTATQPWLRSQVKARVRQLREKLSLDEQMLLVLRVDRGMAWTDIARVMQGRGSGERASLSARSAALRQRFHTIKERLRALVQEDGLISAHAAA